MRRIPVIGSVYGGAKTFSETVLTDKGKSFKQVVMVEFPRKGIFSVGFITSEELEEVQAKTEQDVVCVFVPTTPNPTTGFIVLVPRDEVVRLDMTVDDAFKMLLTLGVVVPKWNNKADRGRSCAATTLSVTFSGSALGIGPGRSPHPFLTGFSPCPCAPITAATSTSASSDPRSKWPAGSIVVATMAA